MEALYAVYDAFSSVLAYVFRPLYNFITQIGISDNYIVSIILFTFVIRLVLMPTTIKQQRGMAKQARLQPKVSRIREKYKDYQNRDKNQLIQQETQALYQREGYSSMTAGCLPMLLQLPILTGLYGIIRKPLEFILKIDSETVAAMQDSIKDLLPESGRAAYYTELYVLKNFDTVIDRCKDLPAEIIAKVQALDFSFAGINLGDVPSLDTVKNLFNDTVDIGAKLLLLIPLLSFLTSAMTGLITQIRQKKTNPDAPGMQMAGCTVLGLPLFSTYLTFMFPAGMGIYWIISNLLSFVQTLIVGKTHSPGKVIARMMVEETVERRSKENNAKIIAAKNQ